MPSLATLFVEAKDIAKEQDDHFREAKFIACMRGHPFYRVLEIVREGDEDAPFAQVSVATEDLAQRLERRLRDLRDQERIASDDRVSLACNLRGSSQDGAAWFRGCAFEQRGDGFFARRKTNAVNRRQLHRFKKFPRSVVPVGVRYDSGWN